VWAQLLGAWQWEPVVVAALVGAGLVYGAFWARLRMQAGSDRAGWRHLAAWATGLAVTAVAVLSPLGTLDHQLFWIHMVQHELFIFLAAPLFRAGGAPFLQRTRAGGRRRLGATARLSGLLAGPLVALGCSTAILWLWHAPAAYDLALASEPVHRLEHLSFLGAYLLYWRPLMRSGGTFPVLRTGASRALYVLAGGTQAAVLGALLAFATTPYYRHYADTASAWGFTPLADQQLGGAVMLLSGAAAYVAAAAFTMPDAGSARSRSCSLT
jgi:putative membrane protein